MNNISPLAEIPSPELTTISYSYEPISEFIGLLNDIYLAADTDIQKQTCTNFKDILNNYLGGREVSVQALEKIYENRRHFIRNDSFKNLAKRLYRLAKNNIDIKKVLSTSLKKVLIENNKNISILCRNHSDELFLKSILDKNELYRIYFLQPKQIRKNYINTPLVIISPSYWYKEIIITPCTKKLILIQPGILSKPIFTNDIFDGIDNISLWTSPKKGIKENKLELIVSSPESYKSDKIEYDNLSTLAQVLSHKHPNLYTKEIKSALGHTELIEINRKYLTVDKYGILMHRAFFDNDELDGYSYIVNDIDYSELSDEDINMQLRIEMESWKAPLRDYYQPYELPKILTSLGAKYARDYNIRNWKNKDTIRPKDDDDFKALLKFADIPEVEFSTFFNLAKDIRSNCISIGHKKSEVSRELVAKELRKLLQQQTPLPSRLNVGKIKASILVVG